MKFEEKHIGFTVYDIPSNPGDSLGLWKILKILNYYPKYPKDTSVIQEQKVLIEFLQKYRHTPIKTGTQIWVHPEDIKFSDEYLLDLEINSIMQRMGYTE